MKEKLVLCNVRNKSDEVLRIFDDGKELSRAMASNRVTPSYKGASSQVMFKKSLKRFQGSILLNDNMEMKLMMRIFEFSHSQEIIFVFKYSCLSEHMKPKKIGPLCLKTKLTISMQTIEIIKHRKIVRSC